MPKESSKKIFLKAYERAAVHNLLSLELFEKDEESRNIERNQIFQNWTLVLAVAENCRYSVPFIHKSVPKAKQFIDHILWTLDEERFKRIVRLDKKTFWLLCELIQNDNVFDGARCGKQYPVEQQLIIVLYRIGVSGEGATIGKIASLFGVGDGGTIQIFTKRVFRSILRLKTRYLNWPTVSERSEIVAQTQHELPFCVGYVDGTEIKLAERPLIDPESYYSRKSIYSIKMQAVCDKDLRFRHVVVGYPGSVHDARIFNECDLSTKPYDFFGGDQWIAGDSAYKITSTVLTPFRSSRLSNASTQFSDFNKAFSKYRVRIEHAFGILKERFSSLKELRVQIGNNESIRYACEWIVACVIIHNVAIDKNDSYESFVSLENCDVNVDHSESITNATAIGEHKRQQIILSMNL